MSRAVRFAAWLAGLATLAVVGVFFAEIAHVALTYIFAWLGIGGELLGLLVIIVAGLAYMAWMLSE